MRTGMLADALLSMKADVTWWHSTFDHFKKSYQVNEPGDVEISPGYRLRLLDAGSYKRNISLARFRHHQNLGKIFLDQAPTLPRPDAIVCSYPIPDLASAVVRFGKEQGIPVIVDVRDLWPDIFVHKSPALMRPVVRLFTARMLRQARWVMENASAIVAVSESYLRWGLRQSGREPVSGRDMVLPIGFQHQPSTEQGDDVISKLLAPLHDKTIISFVGSFSYSYDLETVAKAASDLWESGRRDLAFVLAGDGQQMDMLKQYAKNTGNILLPGWLDRSGMDALLERADMGLVCCHSVPGTMPNKVSQYLAFGLPLLSSLEGDSEKLIEEYGIGESYKVGDVTALKNNIATLADDKNLLGFTSSNAASVFLEKFEAEKIYRKYSELVLQLASTKL